MSQQGGDAVGRTDSRVDLDRHRSGQEDDACDSSLHADRLRRATVRSPCRVHGLRERGRPRLGYIAHILRTIALSTCLDFIRFCSPL